MKRLWNLAGLPFRKAPVVGATPADVVHRENKWRLLRYRARPEGLAFRTPLLLVPSLINRHYVLDLMPGKSLAEYLVAQGHDLFVIDWGTPEAEDRFLTFDELCDDYLGRAVRIAGRAGPSGKANLLGYCLGGTLALIHAAARPDHVASLALLAAPVRFHDDGLLSRWTRSPAFDVDSLVAATGNVPWQLMQAAFQLLRPTLPLSKTVSLLDKAWDDRFLEGFLALERWGSDNVSFPGEAYRRYVQELYRGDALANGTFTLSGRPVRLGALECPTLAVTFEHDGIVPWQGAAAVLDLIGSKDKQRIHLPGGHVGAVVSRAASKELWPALSAFWGTRDGAPAVRRKPEPAKAKAKAKAAGRKKQPRRRGASRQGRRGALS